MKLSGGLPTGRIGKIGLDIYPKNPEILYAILINCNPGPKPGTSPMSNYGRRYTTLSHGNLRSRSAASRRGGMSNSAGRETEPPPSGTTR